MTNIHNTFIGAWISPNGDIYNTNNIQSHLVVIRELRLEQYLKSIRDTLTWTDSEQKNHKYDDLPYIALKIGYIRILSYNDQIAIQYGKNITDVQSTNIKHVLTQIIQNSSYISFTITVEHFEQTFKMFNNINDAINELTISLK